MCEVLSPRNATDNTVKKLRLYHRVAIPHYWLGYVTLMRAERGEVVRAEPFEAIELAIGTLFGDDPP